MAMIITYQLGTSLYINLTNRCTNKCIFCIRDNSGGIGGGLDLWLDREPTVDEVMVDIASRGNLANIEEFVFCGYGEPLVRLDEVTEICQKLKEKYKDIPIRINTNGQANLIMGKDITPRLTGRVDCVSISLNTSTGQSYQKLCQPYCGEKAFAAVLDFAEKSKICIPKVILSVVDVITGEDIAACRRLALAMGVDFKVRHYC